MNDDQPGAPSRASVAVPQATSPRPPNRGPRTATSRVIGVDVTRGIALIGMMAVHIFNDFHSDGSPSLVMRTAGGRAAATFALLAGVSLAFMTGGRHPVRGQARVAASASLTVRAVLIGLIGLALGYIGSDVAIILPYYALIFLLAIPLVGLRPRILAALSLALSVLVPLFLLATGLPDYAAPDNNLTFGSLLLHPIERTIQLLFTGDYPAVAWMVYICAGLAIGRLDLSSTRVAAALFGGGAALALTAWSASSLLLFQFGGVEALREAGDQSRNAVLWDPDYTSSWWWLAVRAPYAVTPPTLLSTLGVAVALLGTVLLLTRAPFGLRLLAPVAAAGTMTLTLYSGHLVVLATGLLSDESRLLFVLLVAAALGFAARWRRTRGQGPLEAWVSVPAIWVRRAVAGSGPAAQGRSG